MILKENWLTKKPREGAFFVTIFMTVLLSLGSVLYLNEQFWISKWIAANHENVFTQHQYWRLWSSLFAHGDLAHLLSNLLLFFPLSFFLVSYFGVGFFPLFGVLAGGLINFWVLSGMAAQTYLIGFSGVVYWMGSAWLTLYLLIERRESLRRRFAKVLFVSVVLFVPEAYKVEVSYLSHFYGYLLGIISAGGYYLLNRRRFLQAEVYVPEPMEEPQNLPPVFEA